MLSDQPRLATGPASWASRCSNADCCVASGIIQILDGKSDSWKATHVGPWQQWRLRGTGGGEVEILSEHSGLRLTTMATPHDWADVWLDRKQRSDWSARWRLKAPDDGVVFLIQNTASSYALDAGEKAGNGRDPHVWSSHWAPWQQWIIMRLPPT